LKEQEINQDLNYFLFAGKLMLAKQCVREIVLQTSLSIVIEDPNVFGDAQEFDFAQV